MVRIGMRQIDNVICMRMMLEGQLVLVDHQIITLEDKRKPFTFSLRLAPLTLNMPVKRLRALIFSEFVFVFWSYRTPFWVCVLILISQIAISRRLLRTKKAIPVHVRGIASKILKM